jgi:hypothetical protein
LSTIARSKFQERKAKRAALVVVRVEGQMEILIAVIGSLAFPTNAILDVSAAFRQCDLKHLAICTGKIGPDVADKLQFPLIFSYDKSA